MENKDKNFLNVDVPLILENEVNKPSVLNKEIIKALVLKDEISSTSDLKSNDVIKIKDLVKLKNLSSVEVINTPVSDSFLKNFTSIKDEAKKINNDIKKKTSLINHSIDDQKKKIQLLYDEKKSLDQNRYEFNENKNQIQSDIINNQLKLIESNKLDNKKLKGALDELEIKLKETIQTNRSLEIGNHELKNTVNRYISHNKKLDEQIKQTKNTTDDTSLNSSQINQINNRIDDRIKFYQEENIRLSSELASFQSKYETISKNFTEVELEKNSIFNQIQELNNSLSKTNFVDRDLENEAIDENLINIQDQNNNTDDEIDNKKNNDKSDKNLDGEITDIFN